MLITCIILLGAPLINGLSLVKDVDREYSTNFFVSSTDNAPAWADGYINGTWGIREYILFIGMVEIEIGNISGYYTNMVGPLNRFIGEIYTHWDQSKKSEISGLYFGSFIIGQLGDIDIENITLEIKENETGFGGYGDQNETNFDWRIVSKSGPTYYLKGTFSKFE